MLTAAPDVLGRWKSASPPDDEKWIETMTDIVSYKQILARVNNWDEDGGHGTRFVIINMYEPLDVSCDKILCDSLWNGVYV